MNRLLEYSPATEEAVVSRILVQIHKAVDEHFPSARQANRQFTKTVFSEDTESTALNRMGFPAGTPAGADDDTAEKFPAIPTADTAPGQIAEAADRDTDPSNKAQEASRPPSYISQLDPTRDALESQPASKLAASALGDLDEPERPDWLSITLIGASVAGVILLLYLLFVA